MIELSKHIEFLLLENDCVVVPDLGGFIAHEEPAHYEESEGVFYPPIRTVGFNPQLTMNDGVLTQSYMQAYHTDFPDATRKIASKVEEVKEILYKEGRVELLGVGELCYNIRGAFEFHPQDKGIVAPSLYGLDAFSMPLLSSLEKPTSVSLPMKETKEIRLNPQWWGHAVAVAVAAILFFVLSVPVENTYIDKGNYASLGTDCLFDAIRTQSMATACPVSVDEVQQQKNRNLKPVAVRVEKVAPAAEPKVMPERETPKKEIVKKEAVTKEVSKKKEIKKVEATKKVEVSKPVKTAPKAVIAPKKYHLIVASLPTSADAEKMKKSYHQKGYKDASVVAGNGRYRIALCSYSDKSEAYQKLNQLKQEEAFKSAWMLSSK